MSKEEKTKEELEDKIEALEQTIRVLNEDLIHDSLTGLKTRKFFEQEAKVYFEAIRNDVRSVRRERFGFKHLSFIFFDIDYFKKINDTHGHATGDGVLKTVACTIQNGVRTGDIAARWGGEEIIVALLGVDEAGAIKKAEAIRKSIERFSFNNLPDIQVTVSAGVSTTEPDVAFEELIIRADKALYEAKETGRNKVIAWSLGHWMSK
ncbi:MAG: GGDEF domain-containing protein [bacterium]